MENIFILLYGKFFLRGCCMAKKSKMGWGLKFLLVLLYDIYGIYRRLTSGKILPIIIGILQIFTVGGCGIIWLIDLICVLFKKEVTVLV